MEQYIIKGGISLNGEVEIGGAKNAALAILAAANMTNETVYIDNLPDVRDINALLDAMAGIGTRIDRVDRHAVTVNGSSVENFIVENEVQIAALTIPKTKAPEIADRLVRAGVKAIWNFAHTDLVVPDDVVVENVHLSESLMRLSYRVCNMQDQKEREQKEG